MCRYRRDLPMCSFAGILVSASLLVFASVPRVYCGCFELQDESRAELANLTMYFGGIAGIVILIADPKNLSRMIASWQLRPAGFRSCTYFPRCWRFGRVEFQVWITMMSKLISAIPSSDTVSFTENKFLLLINYAKQSFLPFWFLLLYGIFQCLLFTFIICTYPIYLGNTKRITFSH